LLVVPTKAIVSPFFPLEEEMPAQAIVISEVFCFVNSLVFYVFSVLIVFLYFYLSI